MIRMVLVMTLGLQAAVGSCLATEPTSEQSAAIAEIEKSFGQVRIDEKHPDGPVISIELTGPYVTDDTLKHIKPFAEVRSLNLSESKITDKGLKTLPIRAANRPLNVGAFGGRAPAGYLSLAISRANGRALSSAVWQRKASASEA